MADSRLLILKAVSMFKDYKNFLCLLIIFIMCVHAYVFGYTWNMHGDQRTIHVNQCLPSIMWSPGIAFRLLDLAKLHAKGCKYLTSEPSL